MEADVNDTITLREGDVFDFRWNEGAWERAKTRMGGSDLNWCFEGQLICKPRHDGTLHLVDNFWGSGSENKSMTLDQAQRDGMLTFLCNLAEVEAIRDYDHEYFKPGDVFCLTSQHGLQKRYVKRKDAERDRDTMLNVIRQRRSTLMKKIESDARFNAINAERLAVVEYQVEHGDTSVSIPEVRS